LGEQTPSVLEGRDIGTRIFPDAGLKIYLAASARVRANRRAEEYRRKNTPFDLETLLREIEERDHRDMNREHDPLRVADGAYVIDTSELSIEQQVTRVLQLAESIFQIEVM